MCVAAAGSQVLQINCCCCILFFVVAFLFFRERIIFEERQLIFIFGHEYEVYRHRVKTVG